jgi:hypothetical protein
MFNQMLDLLYVNFFFNKNTFFDYLSIKIHTFDRVWVDYKKRTDIERVVPRPFSLVSYQYNSNFTLIFINRNECLP